jgi:serine phosphatase RsbU (regulator of sigma subunit)
VASTRFTTVCELDVGDTLICYTDGLIEHHEEVLEAGRERLIAVATENATTSPDTMIAELLRRVPNAERPDDIAVLALRRTR